MADEKTFKKEIEEALEQGKYTDYGWNGEDEIAYDAFDTTMATDAVLEVIKGRIPQSSQKLFDQFCFESGMNADDVRATSWHPAGMVDYTAWLLEKMREILC